MSAIYFKTKLFSYKLINQFFVNGIFHIKKDNNINARTVKTNARRFFSLLLRGW